MQRSHLSPGHGARLPYLLGTNVNTPFFQVPALEFDRVLGHKSGHRVPVCTSFLFWGSAVDLFVLAAKLMFQNNV